jgi:hypothetical protein
MVLEFGGTSCRPPSPKEYLSSQHAYVIRADSELFEAVVGAQLAAGGKNYPYRRPGLRFDSRPSGKTPDFLHAAGGSRGLAPATAYERPDSATLAAIARNRQQILKLAGVEEGGPFLYPRCGGTLVPPPAPNAADPRASCPKQGEHYLTVWFPIRGFPEALKKLRRPDGKPVELTGDIWTSIVDEAYAGPNGQNWFQHAWVFRRNASSGHLELADTILLAWVE